jgi:hypothetical protein
MHPLIAHFLDLPVAVAALEKADQAVALTPDEQALADSAAAHPKSKAAVLKAKGKAQVSPESQQHLILLTIEAATALVARDATLGPKVAAANAALKAEGAEDEEAHQLVAQAVLEEAFGYAEDPGHFDAEFLAETLDGLVPLSKVDSDVVDAWLEKFAKQNEDRAMRLTVAETLLDAAWSEGPQPISPEHLDDALESLAGSVASSEFAKAGEVLMAFLSFMSAQKIIGPQRLERLNHLVRSALASGVDLDGDLEEEEEDGDEEA